MNKRCVRAFGLTCPKQKKKKLKKTPTTKPGTKERQQRFLSNERTPLAVGFSGPDNRGIFLLRICDFFFTSIFFYHYYWGPATVAKKR